MRWADQGFHTSSSRDTIHIQKVCLSYKLTTERLFRMYHRKWRETKQPAGTAGPGNMLGCCLVSLHFLSYILCSCSVRMKIVQASFEMICYWGFFRLSTLIKALSEKQICVIHTTSMRDLQIYRVDGVDVAYEMERN